MSTAFLNTTSMDDLIKLEEVSVHYTENGDFEVTADGGVLGKVKVKVNVPGGGDAKLEESGSFKITENGEYSYLPEAEGAVFSDVNVKVDVFVPKLEEKEIVITENGDYSYSAEGGNGFNKIRVLASLAEKFSEGLGYRFIFNESLNMYLNEYGVTDMGSCTDKVVTVPCAYNSAPVVSVGAVTDNGNYGFSIEGVESLYLPDTVTKIVKWGIARGTSLKYIKFGRYFSEVEDEQYPDGGNLSGVVFDFSSYARSTPPTLADTSFLNGVVEVRVPAATVDAWKAATNWSTVADKIVGV